MKTERMLNAIGNIDDNLITGAMESTAGARKSWLRRGAVAACACLVLSIPVLAVAGGLLVRFFPNQSRWDVQTQARIPVSEFSQEVRALSAQLGEEDGYYEMESVEAAERFLGVELPDNPLLDRAVKEETKTEFADGTVMNYHCQAALHNNVDELLVAVRVWAAYRYDGVRVDVLYNMVTDLNPYENGGAIGMEIDRGNLRQQRHTTPSGTECTIIFDQANNDCYGYVVVDGILIELTVTGSEQTPVCDMMRELLDAFG